MLLKKDLPPFTFDACTWLLLHIHEQIKNSNYNKLKTTQTIHQCEHLHNLEVLVAEMDVLPETKIQVINISDFYHF